MERREFLKTSLASSVMAASGGAVMAESPVSGAREFYLLRSYSFTMGPQTQVAERYFGEALIPALGRMGIGPVGAFRLDIGPQTPTFYLLIPGASVEMLAMLELHLAKDAVFMKAAEPFWSAAATSPAFGRMESSLLVAFEGWPKLTPLAGAAKDKRIFQLRTYESPSDAAHVRKVEMFNNGEFAIFTKAGAHAVFYADTLVGSRMPSLTYMLSFADMAALNAAWAKFVADPAWTKLKSDPRYSYEEIVSNITNLVLSPLACSQI